MATPSIAKAILKYILFKELELSNVGQRERATQNRKRRHDPLDCTRPTRYISDRGSMKYRDIQKGCAYFVIDQGSYQIQFNHFRQD